MCAQLLGIMSLNIGELLSNADYASLLNVIYHQGSSVLVLWVISIIRLLCGMSLLVCILKLQVVRYTHRALLPGPIPVSLFFLWRPMMACLFRCCFSSTNLA